MRIQTTPTPIDWRTPVALLVLALWAAPTPNAVAMVDVNTNQMSDVWEAAYSMVDADPLADPDSDDQNNQHESVAGTDPNDAQSVLHLEVASHLPSAHLVRWNSVAGKQYQLEASVALLGGPWVPQGAIITGTGGEVVSAFEQGTPPFAAFRIRLLTDNTAVSNASPFLESVDTDLDGMPDVDEWAAGTNPFDASSLLEIGSLTVGDAVLLTWPSVIGKRYQVESTDTVGAGPWTQEGDAIEGTGSFITAAVQVSDDSHWFRVGVSDFDSDLDGVSDWEEEMAGLEIGPWHYRTNFPTDPAMITAIVTSTNVVNVQPGVAVANATRSSPGSFIVTRSGNLNALTLDYTVGGDAIAGVDYEVLPGSVFLPPGIHSVEIPVAPLSGAGLGPARSVMVTLNADPSYSLGTNTSAQVNVVKESALVVTDFGAVGDGVTDDTLPIQAAIDALEASTTHNTLHFPAGIYRLNTPTPDTSSVGSAYRLLKLGNSDLSGRDLFFTGHGNATLYSTVSSVRAEMLIAVARFRSLSFHDLNWKKNDSPLPATTGSPNGASGVALVRHEKRRVELVDFLDCTFDNCHAAVSMPFPNGYNTRGELGLFRFRRCTVLNPFGSNTLNAQSSFGGGQQLRISAWVDWAVLGDNTFVGGGDPVDPGKNPGGVRKDGSYYGGALHLVFTNNIVRLMGVEAVMQFDDPRIAVTAGPLTFPAPDGSTAGVVIHPAESTFQAGQLLNFRTPLTPQTTPGNVLMTVFSYEPTNAILTVTNPGLSAGVAGTTLPADRPVYLLDYNPTFATIADNAVLDGEPSGFIGIEANARATITRNYIQGYFTGITLYENVRNPVNPPTPGTLLDSNIILTKDTTTGYPGLGIESFGPGEIISSNLIVTPRSYRFAGATVRRTNAWVEANTVLPIQVTRNGYTNLYARSVGIGFGNGSSNNTAAANSTYGMDVGIGPAEPFQNALHRVLSHFSTNDVLAIDPIGQVP